ncbi:hypothetical protein [Nocardioides sp. KR10-350]|uniref:hypothetical protein n=1 Tax=Nocardioides cheoyonin TaxID=3156615 RepID=UPI0032B4D52E
MTSLKQQARDHIAKARAIHDSFEGKSMPAGDALLIDTHLTLGVEYQRRSDREARARRQQAEARPATADDLRARLAAGQTVSVDDIAEALRGWQDNTDRLVKQVDKRERQGKTALRSEADALTKSRHAAYELAQLHHELQPVHRRPMFTTPTELGAASQESR